MKPQVKAPIRNEWIEFNIYPEQNTVNALAKARINGKNEVEVKLLFHANPGQYDSFIGDARTEAKNIFSKRYKIPS
jgi:hypothetical protein